eukprot:scaffold37052_cov34-Phaeocystis_antarctica.AAC.3
MEWKEHTDNMIRALVRTTTEAKAATLWHRGCNPMCVLPPGAHHDRGQGGRPWARVRRPARALPPLQAGTVPWLSPLPTVSVAARALPPLQAGT